MKTLKQLKQELADADAAYDAACSIDINTYVYAAWVAAAFAVWAAINDYYVAVWAATAAAGAAVWSHKTYPDAAYDAYNKARNAYYKKLKETEDENS